MPQDTPVLSNDRVFLVFGNALRAYRFDCGAHGATCQPLWKATGEGFYYSPAVAEGLVHAFGVQPAPYKNQRYGSGVYRINCRSNRGECRPLFRYNPGQTFYSTSIANGVLYTEDAAIALDGCAHDESICKV